MSCQFVVVSFEFLLSVIQSAKREIRRKKKRTKQNVRITHFNKKKKKLSIIFFSSHFLFLFFYVNVVYIYKHTIAMHNLQTCAIQNVQAKRIVIILSLPLGFGLPSFLKLGQRSGCD